MHMIIHLLYYHATASYIASHRLNSSPGIPFSDDISIDLILLCTGDLCWIQEVESADMFIKSKRLCK